MDPNQESFAGQHPLKNYEFSAEEIKVLKECNTESFYQRSLPLASTFGLAAYAGIQYGYLKPSVKYGSAPKVAFGVLIGYFIGKFSYQQKCAEKLMRLPNSRLAEIIRARQSQQHSLFGIRPDQNLGMTLTPFAPSSSDVYTDEYLQPQQQQKQGSALNLNVEDRPAYGGLDDIYRPSLDNPINAQIDVDIPIEPVKPGMTYNELRQRNRDEYLKRQQSSSSQPPPSSTTMAPPYETARLIRQKEQTPSTEETNRNIQRNKYGDAWSE